MIFLLQSPAQDARTSNITEIATDTSIGSASVPDFALLDIVIFIVLTLMILSIIAEKATTFIYVYFMKRDKEKNPIVRSATGEVIPPDTKHEIEKKVTVVSIVVGIFIAFFFKANIFEMFTSKDPTVTLFWGNVGALMERETHPLWYILKLIIGIPLTGFFLSFGSKFFHDLLDLLLASKNLRRAMSQQKQTSILQQEEGGFVPESEFSTMGSIQSLLSKGAVGEVKKNNVIGAKARLNEQGKAVLQVEIEDEDTQHIPSEVTMKVRGRAVKVPVEVKTNAKSAKPHIGSGHHLFARRKNAGGRVAPSKGTVTCTFQSPISGDIFAMTCAHVVPFEHVPHQTTKLSLLPDQRENYIFDFGEQAKAELVYLQLDEALDIAVLKLHEGHHSNQIGNQDRPLKPPRPIVANDMEFNTPVLIANQNNELVEGYIVEIDVTKRIDYNHGPVTINRLFLIQGLKGGIFQSVTQPGDSGAIVIDKHTMEVLGIVLGATGDEEYTIAMSFDRALNSIGMNLNFTS